MSIYVTYWKRWMDVGISIIFIFILFFPLIVVSMLIYIDDPGTIIFKQSRVGKDGSLFEIFKFRTMFKDTPSMSTEEMLKSRLNKVTRVGKFLRKTSLDELPQLFNVLSGEMSIIGPRPALPTQKVVLEGRRESRAYLLKPGMTGLAQICGRDTLTDEQKIQFDATYAEKVAFLYDIHIIVRTMVIVVNGLGAN